MREPTSDEINDTSPSVQALIRVFKGDVLAFAEPDSFLSVSTGWLGVSLSRNTRRLIEVILPGEIISAVDAEARGLIYLGATDVDLIASPLPLVKTEPVPRDLKRKSEAQSIGVLDRLYLALNADGEQRLAHLILMLMDRSRHHNTKLYDRFFCPLSQTQIGDLIGVSNVHVSRMFARLEQKTLVRRYKSFIQIVDRPKLEQFCGYANRWQ